VAKEEAKTTRGSIAQRSAPLSADDRGALLGEEASGAAGAAAAAAVHVQAGADNTTAAPIAASIAGGSNCNVGFMATYFTPAWFFQLTQILLRIASSASAKCLSPSEVNSMT